MSECICSSCKNLKGIMDENGAIEQYECELGFPSESCPDCEADGCELTCANYICDDEEDSPIILTCNKCGKELKQVCGNAEEGEVYCIDCYLKNVE